MDSIDPVSSPESWLQQNIKDSTKPVSSRRSNEHYNSFRLQALPVLLAVSALVVAGMWYREEELGLVSAVDRVGYPVLLTVCLCGAVLLLLRPSAIRKVMATAFFFYIAHIMASYYQEMLLRLTGEGGTSTELLIIVLWLPLAYVGSFVFFSLQKALRVSLLFYAAIAIPQLMLLATEVEQIARHIAFSILVSPPVYIAAMWGVGLLKQHVITTHERMRSLSSMANADALTGVASRRSMSQVLEAVTGSHHNVKREVALIIFDVDHFKGINDSQGHAVGDEVLRRLAEEAKSQMRSSDLLARWGGEEFIILTLDQGEGQVMQLAERLRTRIEALHHPAVGQVTVSLGVTSLLQGEDVHAFIHRADMALYKAKSSGRNRVECDFG